MDSLLTSPGRPRSASSSRSASCRPLRGRLLGQVVSAARRRPPRGRLIGRRCPARPPFGTVSAGPGRATDLHVGCARGLRVDAQPLGCWPQGTAGGHAGAQSATPKAPTGRLMSFLGAFAGVRRVPGVLPARSVSWGMRFLCPLHHRVDDGAADELTWCFVGVRCVPGALPARPALEASPAQVRGSREDEGLEASERPVVERFEVGNESLFGPQAPCSGTSSSPRWRTACPAPGRRRNG